MQVSFSTSRSHAPQVRSSGYFIQQSRGKCRWAVVARAKSARRPHETDLSKLPPELQTYYTETTKNLVELNRARMKALEDLKLARSKISELEAENVELRRRQGSAFNGTTSAPGTNGLNGMNGTAARHDNNAAPPPMQQMVVPPHSMPTSNGAPPQPSAPPAQAPPGTITIQYKTGWKDCFIHYNCDGKGWTTVPGERMESVQDGYKSKTMTGKRVEFVVTNGRNDWDTPNPYSDKPANYVIQSHGVYRLASGRIEKVQ